MLGVFLHFVQCLCGYTLQLVSRIHILNPARLPIPPSGQVIEYQQLDLIVKLCYTLNMSQVYRLCDY